MDPEESFARVAWASHILDFLYKKRAQSDLVPHEVNPDLEHLDDEFEIDSVDLAVLTRSDDKVRMKFLDSLAELVSPSKGWSAVTATAMREKEDHVEIDVAMNDRSKCPRYTRYIFEMIQNCMAVQGSHGMAV
jgi:hypothetical protein